jgi:glutamate dehydrogenase/leucine dehydrogenase
MSAASPTVARTTFDVLDESGASKVVFCRDQTVGLRAIIAIHSTIGGCAGGGIRMKPYESELTACRDAARLANAMSLKYAAAGMALGGAKAVIIGDSSKDKTPDLLRSFGRFIDEQGGEYFAAEDVGTTAEDMLVIAERTDKLIALPETAGGPGDVSITTAEGVFHAIRACCQQVWGEPSVAGRRVAVQGLGQVGMKLTKMLVADGAVTTVADIDARRTDDAAAELGVSVVPPDQISAQDVDIFSPCALGDAINESNIEEVRAKVIAGAANNVFSSTAIADRLEAKGIVYAVDFIANAGGIVYDDQMVERPRPSEFDHARAEAYVTGVFDRTLRVFDIADERGIPLWKAALSLAETNRATLTDSAVPE